ncbi:MAG: hypothetical protein QM601_14475 [Pseudoxanthomonas sp.]
MRFPGKYPLRALQQAAAATVGKPAAGVRDSVLLPVYGHPQVGMVIA